LHSHDFVSGGACLPITAIDAISPAFEHTKQQLIKPFRINQWAKLALVGFLAGELSSGGGGCSMPSVPQMPRNSDDSQHMFGGFDGMKLPHWDPATIALVITVALVGFVVLSLLFIYLNSVMRFVLFDSVIAKRCDIRKNWVRRHGVGVRFFVWQILLSLVSFGSLAVLIGIPALIAFSLGWFKAPSDHMVSLVLGGIFLFMVFFVIIVGLLIVSVLTKDFVIPQMALENISAVQGWRRLLPMLKSEKGSYAGYIGMKIVLALGAAIVFGIITTIAMVLMLIPAGAIGVAALLAGKAAGLTWTLYTISWAVVAVCIVFLVMFYVVSFVSVPGIVFFPAYSLYFFAARYPALSAILYPALSAPPLPPAPPPHFQSPEPIG
jgi:hypothetical protein